MKNILFISFLFFFSGCSTVNQNIFNKDFGSALSSLGKKAERNVFVLQGNPRDIDGEGLLWEPHISQYAQSLVKKLSDIYWGKDKEPVMFIVYDTARVQAVSGSILGKEIGITRGMLNMVMPSVLMRY